MIPTGFRYVQILKKKRIIFFGFLWIHLRSKKDMRQIRILIINRQTIITWNDQKTTSVTQRLEHSMLELRQATTIE